MAEEQQAPQGSPAQAPAPSAKGGGSTGMKPNVAATLSYVLGFITGIIFYLISKDKFVRFHAMQSIFTFVGLWVIQIVLGYVSYTLSSLVGLVSLVLWIVLMVKAYKGEKFKLPIVGDLAENVSGK